MANKPGEKRERGSYQEVAGSGSTIMIGTTDSKVDWVTIIVIMFAIFITFVDGSGTPYAGFDYIGITQVNWPGMITSGVFMGFVGYLLFSQLKNRDSLFLLSFGIMVALNIFYDISTQSFEISSLWSYGLMGALLIGAFGFGIHKKRQGQGITQEVAFLFMALVFTYFWWNSSWYFKTANPLLIYYFFRSDLYGKKDR